MDHTPIGLNPQVTAETITGLNSLLADFQIFYQNVRGFHWNVQGQNFFELHLKPCKSFWCLTITLSALRTLIPGTFAWWWEVLL